ncbi:MAG: hypothetical protein K9M01_03265 [Candidatus Omnitrophica bacterium]|nr:hypothetical protein [Candidatus Omnitrophota bacterium]
MKKIVLVFVACLLLFSVGFKIHAANDLEYSKNILDLIAKKTLNAYNRQDYLAFFKYYSDSLNQLKTKKYFDNLFIAIYKDRLGDIISKKLIEEKSTLDSDYPSLVYKAICTKCDDVLITVNFQKNSGNYHITRVAFDCIPETISH